MRRTVASLIAVLSFTIGGAAHGDEPKLLWELGGLENPESVLFDAATGTLYVSNVAGAPMQKDAKGYISRVGADGKLITLKWAEGMDAPKGLALTGGKLYAADIDALVEIDTRDGKIVAKHAAPGAKFLNDVAVDASGNVYVSDMATDKIWRLANGKLEAWLESADLKNPNGLLVDGDKLIVAAWGVMTDGFATKVPGHLLSVSLTDKKIAALGSGTPVGNLDGLEPLGGGNFIASDWMAGKVYRIGSAGDAELLLTLTQGTADLGFDPATRTMFLPMMTTGKLLAYRL